MMNIFEKLEEIRQKPEHVRMRYVWLMVSVSMVLVIIVWIMSLSAGKQGVVGQSEQAVQSVGGLGDAKEQLQYVTDGMSSTSGMIKDQIESQIQDQVQQ